MRTVDPEPLDVTAGGRRVPAVRWQAASPTAPLVLLGHGGGSHKTAPRQVALARRLVAGGLTVLAIDGPAHGERAVGVDQSPGRYQAELVARGIDVVVDEMVEDWLTALEVARSSGSAGDRVGYLGLSMGTRFGLPLAAALGDRLTCGVLGKFGLQQSPALHPGLHDRLQLRSAAERVTAPILWHVQWDDELFPRAGQFEMFDHLGSTDKRLIAFPGLHGMTADAAVEAWLSFLARGLLV